jgi:hypothetical protein
MSSRSSSPETLNDSHLAPVSDIMVTDPPFPNPSTPRQTASQMPPISELSPPNSQHRNHADTRPTLNSTAAVAPNGEAAAMLHDAPSTAMSGIHMTEDGPPATGTMQAQGAVKTHQPTGYQWINNEDAPGWAWENRKAMEEAVKALEGVIDKGKMVGTKFGDPLLKRIMAENGEQG